MCVFRGHVSCMSVWCVYTLWACVMYVHRCMHVLCTHTTGTCSMHVCICVHVYVPFCIYVRFPSSLCYNPSKPAAAFSLSGAWGPEALRPSCVAASWALRGAADSCQFAKRPPCPWGRYAQILFRACWQEQSVRLPDLSMPLSSCDLNKHGMPVSCVSFPVGPSGHQDVRPLKFCCSVS